MNNNSRKKTLKIIFLFSMTATIISGGLVAGDLLKKYREKMFWDEINALKNESFVTKSEETETDILPEYRNLYNANPDMTGWLKIEAAKIDTPVVQTKDEPEYYLRKDFFGNDYYGGTPFIDYRCSIFPRRSFNLIIYGHNTNSDKLFRRLLDYASKSFAEENKQIYFDTLEEKGVYEIVAAFYHDATGAILNETDNNEGENAYTYYNYIELDSRDGFEKFIENINRQNLYKTDVQITPKDKLLTLTCCAGEAFSHIKENGRFVLIAKKTGE